MSAAPPKTPNARVLVDADKARVALWINTLAARQKLSVTAIADRAGVSRGTLYRWLDPKQPFAPGRASLRKIAAALNAPLPDMDDAALAGFAEGEMAAIAALEQPAELKAGANQGVWRLNSRALELVGYLPGDLLLADMSVAPRPGDIVCAQVIDQQTGGAQTVLRLSQPPYLLTRSMDPALNEAPLYVDHDRVSIAGVVTRSLRQRRA